MKTRTIILLLTATLCFVDCIGPRPECQGSSTEPTSQQDSLITNVEFSLGRYATPSTGENLMADVQWFPGASSSITYRDIRIPVTTYSGKTSILIKDRTLVFIDSDGQVNLITGDFRIYNIRRH